MEHGTEHGEHRADRGRARRQSRTGGLKKKNTHISVGKSAAPGEILKERDERASGRRPQRVTPQKNPTYELCPAAAGELGNQGHGRVALTRWRRLRRGRVGCADDAGPGGSGNGGEVPGGKGAFWGEKGPKRVGPCRAGPRGG